MMQFHSLQLPPLAQCSATEISQLAEKGDRLCKTLPAHIPTVKTPPPRQIDAILADIEKDRPVSLLEWVYCLHAKIQWDRQHPDRSIPTAKAIWYAAKGDRSLKRLLESRLALYRQGEKGAISPSLVKVAAMGWEEESEEYD
ncbi:MAG: hypothetical protein SWY16_25010 [Cyanobacteriota bacterium]|nr:hypothetical protein [Cyanobacteriota bacterium]